MRRKSVFVLIMLFCFSFLLLTQCTGPTRTISQEEINNNDEPNKFNIIQEPFQEKTIIHIAVSVSASEFVVLQQLSARYEVEHPVIIKLDNISNNNSYSYFKKGVQLHTSVDVMLLDNLWVNEFAALGYLHPADEYISADLTLFHQGILNQLKWNGYIWGVPNDIDPMVLVYNKENAAKEGITDWTLEQWLTLNEKLYKPELNEYGIYLNMKEPISFMTLVWALGGSWDKEDMEIKEGLSLNDPVLVERMELFFRSFDITKETNEDIIDSGITMKDFPPAEEDWDPWQKLQQGSITAMITTYSEYLQHSEPGLAISRISTITPQGKMIGSWLNGRSFAVYAKSKAVQEAFSWIRFIAATDNDYLLWQAGKRVPSQMAALLHDSIRRGNDFNQLRFTLESARQLSIEPSKHKELLSIQQRLNDLWEKEQPLHLFMDELYKMWNDIALE